MSVEEKTLKEKVEGALNNEDLQKGLKKSVKNFKEHRKEALEGIDFRAIQQEIKFIKERNLKQLDSNVDKFKKSCDKSGITYIETQNKEDTCNKILEIIQKHGGKKVVKGKSLVTDEIDLNDFLESKGIKSIETDLGEWLIQLAGEKPSHITAPAIHMTKERIANLLNEKFDANLPPDPKKITTFARKKLRKEFIEADIGITGANILIADTGSIVIVTNEGNGRLVSTLPNVHIVLTTHEKFVETMEEATKILHILPRSSVGQPITSYVSIISGPSKTADIEKELVFGVHGPEFVYVIVMDNGRKALLKNNDFKEVLNCIKCGACLGMCPVYQAVGGHVFGRHYIGGVGAVLTAFIENFDATEDMAKLCAGCGICKNICPANIDVPAMVLKLKEYLYANRKVSLSKEMIVKGLFSNKGIFETSLSAASLFNRVVFGKKNQIENLPGPLANLTSFRTLPNFADKTFAQLVKEKKFIKPFDKTKLSHVFFTGCLAEKFYPQSAMKAVEILQSLDYNIIYPESQTCCGVPALYSGDVSAYEKFITENKEVFDNFKDLNVKGIFTVCPSCTKGIADKNLIEDIHVYDFSELLFHIAEHKDLKVKDLEQITYHPSCHYARDEEYLTYTHRLLNKLYNNSFVEYSDMYNCCGAAGSYAIEFPQVSEKILEKKINNIVASGAKNLVIDCPGCMMQIQGYINKNKIDLKTLFITDIFE